MSIELFTSRQALALYNRGFASADAAFQSANARGNGGLSAEELTQSLAGKNGAITAESTADLMKLALEKRWQKPQFKQRPKMLKKNFIFSVDFF